ncbi:penicillin acylase family protein [Enterovibrio sp. ZSDZ42]|uniref:Penicillin acylase family protein n=1 Tax=Enterovibrio gelatinilyticus TaxID=2899819 RepID=A0ABT5R2S4_9GAMM|nr:penicillin acylase family protein [Enterovibrio sp. ZSDZ42]MDD1794570.1 penicillin acylase family protein [Enterovibrio sp. ZSDZ42]
MLKVIKFFFTAVILLALLATALVYGALALSLPALTGVSTVDVLSDTTYLQRDDLGTAIVVAQNRADASYALGYAHGQDRFFQMDLLRRNAAGELSEFFGIAALPRDELTRFHLFRKRSRDIVNQLPSQHRQQLEAYAKGVNDAVSHSTFPSFEYLVTQTDREPWLPEDSLLVIFSMYLDLQGRSLKRDLTFGVIENHFGPEMVAFLSQPSKYQAALDGSRFELKKVDIPLLPTQSVSAALVHDIDESPLVGSNNWAVGGSLTRNGLAMLSDDMHLGINVPVIWYRAQLNYQQDGKPLQITGVTLPGAPAVVVGANGHIAWGFTNGYMDTADWYELGAEDKTTFVLEDIPTKQGNHKYLLEMSEIGPVTILGGKKYALSWVAYQKYAVNLNLLNLETSETVDAALSACKDAGIPVQNMVVADKEGNIGWQATGAIPDRRMPAQRPLPASQYDLAWHNQAKDVPFVVNPKRSMVWTGNSRVVSTKQDARFGNGGYALGARSAQIKQRLFEKDLFDPEDFYRIQLDNEAYFLDRWHTVLLAVLQKDTARFAEDIKEVENWQRCACADSVGYTLVRKYRDALMDSLFAPLETQLAKSDLSLGVLERQLEPALWQLVSEKPESWLPNGQGDWDVFFADTYEKMRDDLMLKMTDHVDGSLQALRWGDVNQLNVQHPFSRQIPLLSSLLDMPKAPGFGDRYMPAVQGQSFGASQRLIVQPGDEVNGILTLPGGQSGHPLSPFYRKGFDEYIEQASTPLLPAQPIYQIVFTRHQSSSIDH